MTLGLTVMLLVWVSTVESAWAGCLTGNIFRLPIWFTIDIAVLLLVMCAITIRGLGARSLSCVATTRCRVLGSPFVVWTCLVQGMKTQLVSLIRSLASGAPESFTEVRRLLLMPL